MFYELTYRMALLKPARRKIEVSGLRLTLTGPFEIGRMCSPIAIHVPDCASEVWPQTEERIPNLALNNISIWCRR
jgi:hypothetical protein